MRVVIAGVLVLGIFMLTLKWCSRSPSQLEEPLQSVANTSPAVTPEAQTVAFCDLVQQPDRYDQKLVRTQATAIVDHLENAVLLNSECKHREAYMHFRVESDQARLSLDAALGPFIKGKVSSANVTIVGQFFGPNKEGYGHLNGYNFEFLIKKVEKAEPIAPDALWP